MKQTSVTLEQLAQQIAARDPGRRIMVGLAGAPGSGKSTSAEILRDLVIRAGRSAGILQMDGFHYDDRILVPRGLRSRKGAPDTFDTAGLAALLVRLKSNAAPEIFVPVFDRDLEIARAAASSIRRETEVVIVEGNYLLLDRPGWQEMAGLFDVTAFLDVPEVILRERLMERWSDLPADEALQKVESNDLPNGKLVMTSSRAADFVVQWDLV